jgi:hypothetical protein
VPTHIGRDRKQLSRENVPNDAIASQDLVNHRGYDCFPSGSTAEDTRGIHAGLRPMTVVPHGAGASLAK